MKTLFFKIFFFILISQSSFAQLDNFILNVTKTDETCTGNGSLTFNVENGTSGSTLIYRIYRLPDVVNALAVLSSNTFGGLSAGNYRVIATQTLGASSGTQQQDITILDARSNLTYTVSSTAQNCEFGTINIAVLTGNPSSYEIISGPVTFSPQSSNSFTNLPYGTYNIRVNDACGEGIVQTYTLTFSNPPNLTINAPTTACSLNTCDSVSISYLINAGGVTTIRYPLNIELTVFPPGGGTPIIQNQIITSGNSINLLMNNIIPLYYAQLYTFNIKVTDACGNIYTRNNNQINLILTSRAEQTYSNCIKGIKLELCNFLPPYRVSFVSSPAGFNPLNYNGLHPGPFADGVIFYTSTLANEMPNGNYQIQVTDSCNRSALCQVNIIDKEPFYSILEKILPCESIKYIQIPQDILNGPFIDTAIITSSTADLGSPIPYDVSSNISSGILTMQLPEGTYTIEGVDQCGHNYSYTFTILPIIYSAITTPRNITGCSKNGLGSINVSVLGAQLSSVIITQAPASYNQTIPHDVSILIPAVGSSTIIIPNLPPGDYTLEITDTCGNHYIKNVAILVQVSELPLSFYEQRGCGENFDSIAFVSPNGSLMSVIITNAPSSFPFNLPYDVSFNIASNGAFYMNSFPEGNYTFNTIDICNQVNTNTYFLTGYHEQENIEIIPNCGSFDLKMRHIDNKTIYQTSSYWLQKFNSLTNQWEHPLTGSVYVSGSLLNNTNSYILNNLSVNYNIAATGLFRILVNFNYYSNGISLTSNCIQTVKTFEYNGDLKIISAYAIPCVNGGSQVYIVANGTPPLNYKITSKDGSPFFIDNGTSNSFSGLETGIYNFRVEDVCGNIVNRLFDINNLQEPEITANNLCDGFNGELYVQPFSFINYEWWKGDDTSTILSTTNTLQFNPFTTADAGVYHVRIFSTTLNSCVDRVLTYTIPVVANPNAGIDGFKTICGSSPPINLFSILNEPYDTGGTWEEITTSGMLVGSNWSMDGLPFGTYVFKYTVNGFCDNRDESFVTITINQAVETPEIVVNSTFCLGDNIEFFIQNIPNATYQWNGPNEFQSSLQNPIITNATTENSGEYTVVATVGDCSAESSVLIAGSPIPIFTLDKICENGVFKITVTPIDDSFDPNDVTYSWSGPNNFTSTDNPLILTNGVIGNYNVNISSNENCFSTQSINVASTFCDFPNAITPDDDGLNDSFDLTNFDVILLQIYNRWGRLVYEKNNYLDEWHGQNMHGGFLPDSTYYYFAKFRSGEQKYGWVFLGRG